MEEEPLEKCKDEEAKKDARKGRGEPLAWRIVERKEVSTSKMGRRLLARIFPSLREYSLQRNKSMHAGGTEEEVKQQ